MEVPRLGVALSRGILNPRSKDRDGKPATSWFLIGFVSAAPRRELLQECFNVLWIQVLYQMILCKSRPPVCFVFSRHTVSPRPEVFFCIFSSFLEV